MTEKLTRTNTHESPTRMPLSPLAMGIGAIMLVGGAGYAADVIAPKQELKSTNVTLEAGEGYDAGVIQGLQAMHDEPSHYHVNDIGALAEKIVGANPQPGTRFEMEEVKSLLGNISINIKDEPAQTIAVHTEPHLSAPDTH